jgi:hypothetical protein
MIFVIDDRNRRRVRERWVMGGNGSDEQKDRSQQRRTRRISDRPVRSLLCIVPPLPTDSRHPSLYTINTHPALTNPTARAPTNPHTAPPTLIVVAKNAVGFGPLVTLTVVAFSTCAIAAFVEDPTKGE